MTADQTEAFRALAMAAAELVDEIGDQVERDLKASDAGYLGGFADGFGAGLDVGYRRAEWLLDEAWRGVAAKVRAAAGQRSFTELRDARMIPGGPMYYADLIRHGGTEFAGLGRPRVPAPPGAYEAALAWAELQQSRAA